MQTEVNGTAILDKTLELCQTIVDQPEFQEMRQRIDAFMADEKAREQYETVVSKSERLQHKQQIGQSLSPEEITDFESDRDALMNNAVARGFLDAQQEMQQIQGSVTKYVHKTFEIGRVPEEGDFENCGHGCSCGH